MSARSPSGTSARSSQPLRKVRTQSATPLGKGVGRSIREFKEEVKTVEDGKGESAPEVVEAEIVTEQPRPAVDPRIAELEAREREIAAREEELRRQREHQAGN